MKKFASLVAAFGLICTFLFTGCANNSDGKSDVKDSTVVFQYGDNIVTKAEVYIYINTIKERYESQY